MASNVLINKKMNNLKIKRKRITRPEYQWFYEKFK